MNQSYDGNKNLFHNTINKEYAPHRGSADKLIPKINKTKAIMICAQ